MRWARITVLGSGSRAPREAVQRAADKVLEPAARGAGSRRSPQAEVLARPERCDDTTLVPTDSLSGEEANVMIQKVRSLAEEEHPTRVPAANAGAGES
jgi:hypothetical protein